MFLRSVPNEKTLSLLLTAAILCGTLPFIPITHAAQAPFEGEGTAENPYRISTAAELNEVRNYLDKHFIQTADIDLTEYQY